MKKALAYLKNDIARVEEALDKALESNGQLMTRIGNFLSESKGKRLRPMLALLVARSLGVSSFSDGQIRVAAALELIHLATLLHDDVIDKADTRRGRASVNAQFGEDVAILMADYLLSIAFRTILNEAGAEALCALSDATCRMCEGELFQIEKKSQMLTVDDYMSIIDAKTARLFSACAEVGVRLAGGNEAQVEAVRSYGLKFGAAFQITDDTLDYTASGEKWGKGQGTDISNGKQTLPFIYAREDASNEDRAVLLTSLENGDAAFSSVMAIIKRTGSIERSLQTAEECAREAREALSILPRNQASDYLRELATYVIDRKY